jgi:hypothetical protein
MNHTSMTAMTGRGLRATALGLALLGATAATAAAVDLKLERRAGTDGSPQVCVVLDAKGQVVAGTQNDLTWDAGCAKLESEAQCVVSPHHKKPLHGSIPKNLNATFRSLVFALDNVDPMPDGDLYCCSFQVTGSSDSCCPVQISRVAVSDPEGNALDTVGVPEKVCLLGEGAPPAAAPAQQAAAPAPAAGGEAVPTWLWLVALGAVVFIVAFLILRRAS